MTLRVYLVDNDGTTNFIDYGLNADNYKGISKIEIREESSTVKFESELLVKIPNSNQLTKIVSTAEKKDRNNKTKYTIFDSKIHDTDTEFYWLSAVCSNCSNSSQIAVPKGEAFQKQKIKNTACPKCCLLKVLSRAVWDGHRYKKIGRITQK